MPVCFEWGEGERDTLKKDFHLALRPPRNGVGITAGDRWERKQAEKAQQWMGIGQPRAVTGGAGG